MGRLSPGILLALLGAALAAPVARAERVYLEVDTPHSGDSLSEPIALTEVRGWAGTGLRGKHDVVIVLDRSASTFRASGVDVDGDGIIGKQYPGDPPDEWVLWTSDFGDTIVSAETLAARRLVERLDADNTRMAILSFGGNTKVEAPLGSSRAQLLAALDALPPWPNENGTNMYAALETAIDVFESAPPEPGVTRQREILLLSDGVPTSPPEPPGAAQRISVHAAHNAALAHARIYAYALGPTAAIARDRFDEIVRANGGELLVLDSPADIVEFVPYLSWTSIAKVSLENTTTGEAGRAMRLFPDGSFDGFAPLQPGRNELRFVATSQGGTEASITRWINFEKTPPDPEKLERLRKLLEVRAIETELAERARAKREEHLKKQLEIKPAN
ncbi:MAG: VWA domain-containing protein [Myxococcota bacterium]